MQEFKDNSRAIKNKMHELIASVPGNHSAGNDNGASFASYNETQSLQVHKTRGQLFRGKTSVNAEDKRRLVILLIFPREPRLLDCEDSLLPSRCLAWYWSWVKGEGVRSFLFNLFYERFSAKIKR